MTARRLFLWRHGRTRYNATDRFQGQLDIPLDDVGVAQAERAAAVLAGQVRTEPPVRLVSSDLSRAVASARSLGERLGLPVDEDPRLREINVGDWAGLTPAEIATRWPADFEAWRRGENVKVGGRETRLEAGLRAVDAIRQLVQQQDGGTLLVAAHGGVLRGAVFVLMGLAQHSAEPVPWNCLGGLSNCHWAELTRRPDTQPDVPSSWRLVSYNVGAPAPPPSEASVTSPIWSAAPAEG